MSLFQLLLARPSIRRNATRFKEIASVLAKYGVATFVSEGSPDLLKKAFRGPDGEDLTALASPVRWRMALTELGPAWIKLGQLLSTRADLVGPEMAAELANLQSGTPPDAPEVVRKTVEAELGRPIEEVFQSFDLDALASASIGQVHAATLEDGTAVVVKVQHEGIEENVKTDLDIMLTLAELAEKHDKEIRQYRAARMVSEFQRSLTRELDFGREADHLTLFAENFEGDETVHFPTLYPDLTTRRVLTMERLDGTSVKEVDELKAAGIDTKEVAQKGADAWIKMILLDGFFHADPHPGNMLVLRDGRLGILDCGMVGRLDGRMRRDFEMLVLALLHQDAEDLTEAVLEIADAPPDFDRDAFRAEMTDWCGDHLGVSMERLDAQAAGNEAMALVRRHRLVLPSGIAQLIRTLGLLEGTSRALHRDFNVVSLLAPYAEKIARKRLAPKSVAKEAFKRAKRWDRLMESAPDDLRDILERLRRGTFSVHLQHERLDTTVNRLVYGVLLAALLLASSWLLSASVPPLVGGASLLGLIGFVAAILGAFGLLNGMRKSGWLSRDDR